MFAVYRFSAGHEGFECDSDDYAIDSGAENQITMKQLFIGVLLLALSAWGGNHTGQNRTTGTVGIDYRRPDPLFLLYCTWPEPDGVDDSSGTSRVVADGKLKVDKQNIPFR